MRVMVFVVFATLLLFLFGLAFPHNLAYGSIALAVYSFAYTCITRTSVVGIWLCGLSYIAILIVDSQFGMHVLTDPKSSESVIFPILSGVIVLGLLFSGRIFKRMILHRGE